MKIHPFIKLLRPVQWLKNLMLFFPPFLGGSLLHKGLLAQSVLPIVSFCLASSSAYVLNDITDCSADKGHPRKKFRPLPSGEISVSQASYLASLLALVSILLAVLISQKLVLIVIGYLLLSTCYSLILKHYPIIDIFCIASGFILRLYAGGEAFSVEISEWLFLTVFLLALFLSTGKRYSEKKSLGDDACLHRKALTSYPSGFLDGMLLMTGATVLVTYTMYVISRHSTLLLYTVPLCCFGLLRYILRVQSGKSGDPTESLTRDLPLLLVGICWSLMVGWGIYGQ